MVLNEHLKRGKDRKEAKLTLFRSLLSGRHFIPYSTLSLLWSGSENSEFL